MVKMEAVNPPKSKDFKDEKLMVRAKICEAFVPKRTFQTNILERESTSFSEFHEFSHKLVYAFEAVL